MVRPVINVSNEVSVFTQGMLDDALAHYPELTTFNPVLPGPGVKADTPPAGKITLYYRICTVGNFRFPLNPFQADILRHYRVGFSQLHPHAWQKITIFEMFCRAHRREPDLNVFRCLFRLAQSEIGWYTFEKKPNTDFNQSESKSLHQWRDSYLFIDESALGVANVARWNYARDAGHSRAPSRLTVPQMQLKDLCCGANIRLRPYNDVVLRLAGMNASWARSELRPVVIDARGRGTSAFLILHHVYQKR